MTNLEEENMRENGEESGGKVERVNASRARGEKV